nr:MAG TPA: hypothetical protein [Caudoviricetes sp.]
MQGRLISVNARRIFPDEIRPVWNVAIDRFTGETIERTTVPHP